MLTEPIPPPLANGKDGAKPIPTKTLPANQQNNFMKAGKTLKTKPTDPDQEACKRTAPNGAGTVTIVQRHFARSIRMFEMYCDGEEISAIAEKFGVTFEVASYIVSNYYAYKLRHDPAMKRHVRDTIKSQIAMLMNHVFLQAMGKGESARRASETYLKICTQAVEYFGLRPAKPAEGSQPAAGGNNFQFNFGNGAPMPEPYEMEAQVKRAIGIQVAENHESDE